MRTNGTLALGPSAPRDHAGPVDLAALLPPPGHPWLPPVVVAGLFLAGVAAGHVGARLLARLRRGTRVPPPWCQLAVGLLWALVAARWAGGGLSGWWLPVPLALAWFGVLLSAVDLIHQRLPNALTLPAYPVFAALLAVAAGWAGGWPVAVRALLGCLVFGGLHLLVHLVAPAALGAGDVKLSGSLGAVLAALSWSALPVAAVVAAGLTLVLGGLARFTPVRWGRAGIPHGPGLLAATWLVATFSGAAPAGAGPAPAPELVAHPVTPAALRAGPVPRASPGYQPEHPSRPSGRGAWWPGSPDGPSAAVASASCWPSSLWAVAADGPGRGRIAWCVGSPLGSHTAPPSSPCWKAWWPASKSPQPTSPNSWPVVGWGSGAVPGWALRPTRWSSSAVCGTAGPRAVPSRSGSTTPNGPSGSR
ncbi:Type IV leader peptidase family protein [Goodfellowiella coeruleoviolacea]|uniref:Type IV leader peptidase family protein n=1 Tax=Goodfellowiella coeruleoviolacea TaxID=334858 RepID=A0AAE3GE90_9PSEU|nr:Type IV leader peptidase family protein [Goodfellowiella coeruleoviolacea]